MVWLLYLLCLGPIGYLGWLSFKHEPLDLFWLRNGFLGFCGFWGLLLGNPTTMFVFAAAGFALFYYKEQEICKIMENLFKKLDPKG